MKIFKKNFKTPPPKPELLSKIMEIKKIEPKHWACSPQNRNFLRKMRFLIHRFLTPSPPNLNPSYATELHDHMCL